MLLILLIRDTVYYVVSLDVYILVISPLIIEPNSLFRDYVPPPRLD